MKRVAAVVVCWVLATLAWAAIPGDVEVFDPGRDAAQDISRAVAEAKQSGRRILLDVGGDWCSWCHILDRMFKQNADLSELRERHFIWVKINKSPENNNEAVLARYPKIKGYPHIFVLDRDGRLLHSQDTYQLEEGKSYSKERIRAFLVRWSN
ncbi:MAG: thioredoxin family protein [Betaproteobacteria bacterium]|nr:thioredoxin family protein [Betaproteobacteria bacterium]